MTDADVADRIRAWAREPEHGPREWPTDGLPEDHRRRFNDYRLRFWKGGDESAFREFLHEYARSLDAPRAEIIRTLKRFGREQRVVKCAEPCNAVTYVFTWSWSGHGKARCSGCQRWIRYNDLRVLEKSR